tara:strand:- start:42 stop:701 length:660 start_codon:yes stop_codon:yes gene_type:complete
MSGGKTVVCSYCHTKGHNRQTCPQLRADIDRIKETHGDEHPLVKEHEANRASISKSASKRAKMPRSCTYCHTLGHNRRTCVVLSHDREVAAKKNAAWRSLYYANVKDIGMGIGAMVRFRPRSHLNLGAPGVLWMVIRHEWENINHINRGERSVLCQQISNVGRRVYLSVPTTLNQPSLRVNGWEVVSPSYDFNMPEAWLNGDTGIDTLFENKDKDSRII